MVELRSGIEGWPAPLACLRAICSATTQINEATDFSAASFGRLVTSGYSTPQASRQFHCHLHVRSYRAKPFNSFLDHAPLEIVFPYPRRRHDEVDSHLPSRRDRLRQHDAV